MSICEERAGTSDRRCGQGQSAIFVADTTERRQARCIERPGRRLVAPIAAILIGCLIAPDRAATQSPVHIVITFTEVRIGGERNDSRLARIELTLLGGNRVTDFDQRRRADEGKGGREQERGAAEDGALRMKESVFGGTFRPFEGRGTTGTWRVGPNNSLVRTLTRSSDLETITIALPDNKDCKATVNFSLRPGRTMFVRNGGRDNFDKVHAEQVRCIISSGERPTD